MLNIEHFSHFLFFEKNFQTNKNYLTKRVSLSMKTTYIKTVLTFYGKFCFEESAPQY